jgi:predicted HAD superfamily Cof-like phosphohydrolase
MNRWQELVHEFHEATNSAIGTDPELQHNELRAKLIMEEAVETVAALGFAAHAGFSEPYGPDDFQPDDIAKFHKQFAKPDLIEAIDGICDLIYVLLGTAVTGGFDLDPHFLEVHRANMMKLQGPKRADGKQLKPEGWQPPDHEKVLINTAREREIWKEAIRKAVEERHLNVVENPSSS